MLKLAVFAAGAAAMLSSSEAQDSPAPAKARKICRGVVPTGSIMAKRICLTKEEWAKFNAENARHSEMAMNARNSKPQPEPIPKMGD